MLSLPAGTEMFHFPALPPAALCIQAAATAHNGRRVSPFGHPRITAWLPAPRGLSQAPTSFLGSWCQGIHRVPLKTWQTHIQKLDARVHCAVLKKRTAPPPAPAPARNQKTARNEDPDTKRPFPQDPTACPPGTGPASLVPNPEGDVLTGRKKRTQVNSQCSTRKQWTPG